MANRSTSGMVALACVLGIAACAQGAADTRDGGRTGRDGGESDGGTPIDAATDAALSLDASAALDAAGFDAGPLVGVDAGPLGVDAGSVGVDAGPAGVDAGPTVGVDSGPADRCAGVDCSGSATACLAAACQPSTGTCVTSPRADGTSCGADRACALPRCAGGACVDMPRAGIGCDDGNACTAGDVCGAANVCAPGPSAARCGDAACTCGETPASCASDCASTLPSNACATGTQSRSGCGNARVIGRLEASSGWASGVQNTCTASDRHDDACPSFDVGFDHTYAIFLRAGERVDATLGATAARCASGEEFNSFLKFKFGADATAAGATSCPAFVSCAGGPARGSAFTTMRTYDATADGWLFIIVDGGATAFDEHRGYYTLSVSLGRCGGGGCGC